MRVLALIIALAAGLASLGDTGGTHHGPTLAAGHVDKAIAPGAAAASFAAVTAAATAIEPVAAGAERAPCPRCPGKRVTASCSSAACPPAGAVIAAPPAPQPRVPAVHDRPPPGALCEGRILAPVPPPPKA